MKRLLLLITLLLLGGTLHPAQAAPSADTAYDLVNGVNILRASYGLPPLEINANLMAAAQAQSDYQSSTKTVNILNADGETAQLQATKFGYGDGSEIVATANVYGAFQATAVQTLTAWSKNARDFQNLLDPHTDMGAGATVNSGVIYYTLILAHYADTPGEGIEAPANPNGEFPFLVATPRPDGSIVHLVGFGHTLVLIAEKYGTTVEDLMLLNNLNADSVIYPGQELIIKLPETGPTFTPSGPTFTPGPETPTITVLPTLEPTQTPRPTRTLSPADRPTSTTIPGSTAIPTPTLSPTSVPTASPLLNPSTIRLALIVLIVVAAGLVLAGNVFDKKKGT